MAAIEPLVSTSKHMNRALRIAALAQHQTNPNPMVGAVLVRDGQVVGDGYHHVAGGSHAEVEAIRAAGEEARGATLYVTMEPCAHFGRTAPCADALIEAGVVHVVAAIEDPDPRTAGRGFAKLRAAGIEVSVGDGADGAERLNPRWLAARRARRPFVALKFAMTLDGKIATRAGMSQWITGEPARAESHRLREAYEAIAVGANTITVDNPELTARGSDGRPGPRQPLRVVVDGRLSISPEARVLDTELPGRTLVATTTSAYRKRGGEYESRGGTVAAFKGNSVDPMVLLEHLGQMGVGSLMVEGGGELSWSMVRAGVVDRIYAFIAPSIIGGRDAPTPVAGEGLAELKEALALRFVGVRRLGNDVLLEAVTA